MPFHRNLLRTIGGVFTEDEEEKKRRQNFQASVGRLFNRTKEQVSETVGTSTKSISETFQRFPQEREDAPLISIASTRNLVKDLVFGSKERNENIKKAEKIVEEKLGVKKASLNFFIGAQTRQQKAELEEKLTKEERKLLEEIGEENLLNTGLGVLSVSARTGGVLKAAAKKLRISPEFLAENVQKGIDPIAKSVRRQLNKEAAKKVRSNSSLEVAKSLISYEPKKPAPLKVVNDSFRRFYFNFIDRFKPISDVERVATKTGVKFSPRDAPNITARRYLGIAESAEQRISYKTFKETPTGIEWTGEGLQDIVNDIGRSKQDFNVFLTNRHLEDLSPDIGARMPEIKATFKAAVEELNQALSPDDFLKFEQVANRLYSYQRRILQETLLDSGVISQELFDILLAKHPRYIPLNRVVDDLAKQGAIPKTKDLFTPKVIPLKGIKGSEREIIDPIESIIGNVYIFSEVAARNKVASNIYNLALKTPELREEIRLVAPKAVPVGTAVHKEVVDPVLNSNLVQFVKEMNVAIKTKLKMGKVLGRTRVKDPPEITVMFGSRENTLAHEIGHIIDGESKVLQQILVKDKAINKELRNIADSRYANRDTTLNFKRYIRKGEEKVAELVSMYVTDRQTARKLAPQAVSRLDKFLSLDIQLSKLRKFTPTNVSTIREREERIFAPALTQPKGVLQFFEKGKKRYLKVPDELAESMTGMTEEVSNWIIKVLAKPAQVLRAGATLSPEFSTTNPVRDQWSAFVNAKYGYLPVWDFNKALFDIVGKKEVYRRWIASGGGQSQFVAMDRAIKQQTAKQLTKQAEAKVAGVGGKVVNSAKEFAKFANPLTSLRALSMGMENPTRLGVFKRAAKSQGDFIAAMESREASTDFGRKGAMMKSFNLITAFFNANIQHSEKLLRSMKERPLQTLVKSLPFTALSTLLWYSNKDDPRYSEIAAWKKNLFFIVMLPEGSGVNYLMIPKGDVGIIFGTSAEIVLDWVDKKDPDTAKEMLKELAGSLLPVSQPGELLPTGLRPPIEIFANRSFFTNLPIVPQSREDLIASEQFSTGTSETFKEIGNKLNMSPAQLEHLFVGYTATLGRTLVDLSDSSLIQLGLIDPVSKKPPTLPGENIPVIGGLVKRWLGREPIGSSSTSMSEFYDETKRLDGLRRTAKKFFDAGDTGKFNKLVRENPEIKFAKDMVKLRSQFADIRNLKDRILASDNFTEEEKRQALRELDLTLTELSKIAIGIVDSI